MKIPEGCYVEYSSNNSGGSWWLSDSDWRGLEEAGWEVDWVANDDSDSESSWLRRNDGSGRWLGALATKARRYDISLKVAIAEWEDVTGLDAEDEGCPCCGSPHNFSVRDANGNWVW